MGFLAPASGVVAMALSHAMTPPPPPDITRWCVENIVFDARSSEAGRFNIERFAFLREIHEVLSPEHPCREVTIRASAQIGKTVSVIQPTIGAWHEATPLDSLVVHPTMQSAKEWVDNKWMPMRRQVGVLRDTFGDGRGENRDNILNQETLRRDGSLKVASAGSPADLTGTSRRLVIMDDLSKFAMTDHGDPEYLAVGRASAFEDAKIVRVSVPGLTGSCRITRAYKNSDQRQYHVACPHCGEYAPLTWENFRQNLDPERLHAACFSCETCGGVIEHKHKAEMIRTGRWVAHNPNGDHPGFHLWRAYSPFRDWASIAREYAQVMGWTRIEGKSEDEAGPKSQVEAETEQVFWSDVLGQPYDQATDAPDWEGLRDRAENAADGDVLPRGVVPGCGVLLTAGVDCQDDRMEVTLAAYGRQRQRWTVDYVVIPHHISDEDGRTALNAVLKQTWKTQLGLPIRIDMLAIDGGTYTDDVWSWAKTHPWNRVIIVKGGSNQNGPVLAPMKFERRQDGRAKRRQKRAFMVNVSQLKGDFFTWLKKEDPAERGYCQFARGLGDEYYRQVTAEICVLKRQRSGVVTRQWQLVEPTRRNEGLDTMIYSEAAARRKGWTSMTDDQWDQMEAERGVPPKDGQADLFDAALAAVPEKPAKTKPARKKRLSEILNG
ncbi:terminase [Maritimibacter sp. 55A14]|uniref:phage terminase large subunit family protein n=1 Tax=Maritimibacter sp. 55A14 TaxID=2174844 RepID=UPI000D6083AF|nr:terminase gpA endonuclease subunit [Maritimibacter sp. 55A14]PWE32769.1 terminase [Maritimibacter sp. 55A14]